MSEYNLVVINWAMSS